MSPRDSGCSAASDATALFLPLCQQAAVRYAGRIFTRPHIGLVAEKGPEAIIPLNKPGGFGLPSVTVNAPITINGAAAGHADLSAILAEHARAIAYEVQRVLQIEYEQAAVV
jgi:hypothetical protein